MSYKYLVLATLEGFFSLVAFYSALAVAMPVMHAMPKPHAGSYDLPASPAFPAERAVRSGASLALGAPFFLLAARCAILALGRLRSPEVPQPRLGFPLPVGLDENAMLDLYVVGLGAGVLGVWVPGLEIVGSFLGTMLKESSSVWSVFALFAVVPGVYLAAGAWLSASTPAEGFAAHTRPTKAMWGLCAAGHVVLLSGCFYSPDIERAVGFVLGLVHIVRLLQQAFSYPGGVGVGVGAAAGACEDGDGIV